MYSIVLELENRDIFQGYGPAGKIYMMYDQKF